MNAKLKLTKIVAGSSPFFLEPLPYDDGEILPTASLLKGLPQSRHTFLLRQLDKNWKG
jgi:hypothetical protein